MIDLLIINAHFFNAFLKTFEKQNVSVKDGKFYYISDEDLHYLEPKEVLDAKGKHLIPGLIDIHMHIESSMVPPASFSPTALSHGVTTIVADSHEIANVFGVAGITAFMEQETEMDIFYAIPSSVPSTTVDRETTGGIIGVPEVRALLEHPKVIALGEAMNFKGITNESDSLIRQILRKTQALKPFMPLEGHIPLVSGEDLAKFMFVGLTADHTHQSPESIIEKAKNGIFLEFQKKSITPENMAVINQYHLYEHMALITDDIMVDDFVTGHLDANVRLAIAAGLPAEEAIYTATYTPARRMGFQDRGAIMTGYQADFILLDDVASFTIASVYKNGKRVSNVHPTMHFPEAFYQSVQCRPLTEADLRFEVKKETVCNVIAIQEIGTFTEHVQQTISEKEGFLDWENSGLALIVVMERYGKNGNIGYGFVKNALTKKGAIATTWAHDHHNMMVMGTSIADILAAQQAVLEMQGGYVVSANGVITATCPLPIGGILSDEPVPVLGQKLGEVRREMQRLGYKNTNEIMSFSTLSLPVSPKLKITDFGMMNVHTHELIPLMER